MKKTWKGLITGFEIHRKNGYICIYGYCHASFLWVRVFLTRRSRSIAEWSQVCFSKSRHEDRFEMFVFMWDFSRV